MTKQKPGSRSRRHPARWPWLVTFGGALAISAAALVALAYLVGRDSPRHAHRLEAVLVAVSSPGIALAVAIGALVAGACCLRQLTLHWLAWRPGRIQVAQFSAGTELTCANAEHLTTNFRRSLSSLCLHAPTPVPGAAPVSDFLDVLVDGTRGGGGGALASLVALLRAATPDHAYEVDGVLLERPQRPRYGVAIEVVRLPAEGLLTTTIWGETWAAVMQKAADEASAAILPHTRRCRAPWGVWRGHLMPSGLVHAYEEGVRHERARRYDEALDAYYEAVHRDPMNMVLRLRIGQLQERMGLYLDALATYWGMEAASNPAGARLPGLLHRRRGHSERRQALTSARYRRNVLLGGRVLAQQWVTCPDDPANPTKRDEQRERLRHCLRPRLTGELETLAREDDVPAALAEPTGEHGQFLALRELLARYALTDCAKLRRRVRLRVWERSTLSPATVRLTEECIRTRLRWVRHERDAQGATWPPDPFELRWTIRNIELGWRRILPDPLARTSFRRWHEHYNAACLYALPLQVDGEPGPHRMALAERAVRRLEQATARADSGYIASRRDWVLSEDPDLKGLRGVGRFEEFEVMYFPSGRLTPRRPRNVQQLECSRYVGALLVALARRWEAEWHRRGGDVRAGHDVHLLLDWFGDELGSWTAVAAAARHHRHSGTRVDLLRAMRACADRYGFEPLAVAFPRYEDAPLQHSLIADSCDELAAAAVTAADERLASLAGVLAAPLGGLEAWLERLRRLDAGAQRPSAHVLAQLCDHHAALWQLLERWLGAPAGAAGDAALEFGAAADRLRPLWCGEIERFNPLTLAWARARVAGRVPSRNGGGVS